MSAFRSLLGEAVDLFVPRICAGCGRESVSLCGTCLVALAHEVTVTRPRYGVLDVWGAGEYEGVLRRVLVAYKESGRTDLLDVLGLLLSRSLVAALDPLDLPAHGRVLLVPAPSSASALRRRGGNHVAAVARRAASLLGADGLTLEVAEVLRPVRHRDQVGRGSRARRSNVRGSFRLAPRAEEGLGRFAEHFTYVLVDDICTTGSTLAEGARTLRRAGVEPAAAAVLGIAPGGPRNPTEGG